MKLSNFKYVVGLFVDYRYEKEFDRIQQLLCVEKGVERFHCFVDGKGDILPRRLYCQISPPPPPTWQDGPASYSHFRAIQKIIQTAKKHGHDKFLFVEDDLDFTDDFNNVIEEVEKQLPDDWDMLYYGANHSGHRTREYSPNLLRTFGSACTHCVAFRYTIYDAILSLPSDRTIDWNIANRLHDKFNCYAIWPNVAIQLPGYSYLWKQQVDYSELWKNKGNPV